VPECGVYLHLQSINIFGRHIITSMSNARSDKIKNDAAAIAAKYGIEVVGFLELNDRTRIPAKRVDQEIDLSGTQDPLKILPAARTMIILGKRLIDDGQDIRYQISEEYLASLEMMMLDIASARIIDHLKNVGLRCEEYASDDIKARAALAGLGWVGRSGMFVSKVYGPRLRLKGILTEADIGEPCEILGDDRCRECTECMKACPVGAISMDGVDRKKCAACALNHRQFSKRYNIYAYCTACTASCPVGKGHAGQAISKKRITP
jgi:epoxyqueuosine reductase